MSDRKPWTHMVRTREGNVYCYIEGDRLLCIHTGKTVTRRGEGADVYTRPHEKSRIGERPYTLKVWERDPEHPESDPSPALLLPFLATKRWTVTPSGRDVVDVTLAYRDFPPPPKVSLNDRSGVFGNPRQSVGEAGA